MDNAFLDIDNFQKAQTIVDDLANRFCPIIIDFQLNYHWNIMPVRTAWAGRLNMLLIFFSTKKYI